MRLGPHVVMIQLTRVAENLVAGRRHMMRLGLHVVMVQLTRVAENLVAGRRLSIQIGQHVVTDEFVNEGIKSVLSFMNIYKV